MTKQKAEGKWRNEQTAEQPDAGADDSDLSVAAASRNNGQLSRSMILQTALRIVDRDDVDGLSIRRLATQWAGIR